VQSCDLATKKQHSVYIASSKAKALRNALYNNGSGAWLARPRIKS